MIEQESIFMIEPELSIEDINSRIKLEVCYKTIEKLSDSKLICQYKKYNSVKNKIKKLSNLLTKYTDKQIIEKIIQEYILELVPPGTKGVIRGNIFNNIVKQYIINLSLDANRFEIYFEKNCESHLTHEIPDWYIMEKTTNKIIMWDNFKRMLNNVFTFFSS